MRILIVEDNADTRQALQRALTREGHVVTMAFTAPAAINLLASEALFDLVLLDIILDENRTAPTGWAVAGFMQADRQLRKVPIIVISALEPEAVRSGAQSYANVLTSAVMILGKPVDLDDLLGAIVRIGQGRSA